MNRFASAALALTVLAATAGCMSAPSNLDLSLTRPTFDHKFVVTLQPPAKPAAINQLHSGSPHRRAHPSHTRTSRSMVACHSTAMAFPRGHR